MRWDSPLVDTKALVWETKKDELWGSKLASLWESQLVHKMALVWDSEMDSGRVEA
jgi:hypothetical protein